MNLIEITEIHKNSYNLFIKHLLRDFAEETLESNETSGNGES